MWMYPYYDSGFHSGLWFISPFVSLIFILIFIWVIIRIFGHGKHRDFVERIKEKGLMEDAPIDILKKRYAKGEIDKKQFDEMKKDLS